IDVGSATLQLSLAQASAVGDGFTLIKHTGAGTTTGSFQAVKVLTTDLVPVPEGTYSGAGATGTAVVSGGAGTGIPFGAGGSGYPSPPTVILDGGGGTGATATATVVSGHVTGFLVT